MNEEFLRTLKSVMNEANEEMVAVACNEADCTVCNDTSLRNTAKFITYMDSFMDEVVDGSIVLETAGEQLQLWSLLKDIEEYRS